MVSRSNKKVKEISKDKVVEPNIPVTIILSFLYKKIKERNKGPIIKTSLLKEIIRLHFIVPKNQTGGNLKGIESAYIYDIIEDMINFKLLKRIDHGSYEILLTEDNDSLIKSLNMKVKKLKKDIEYKKPITEVRLKSLNENIGYLYDLFNKDNEFEIIDSNCKKRLRKFPF